MKRLSMFLLWVFVMCNVISLTSADPLLIPYTYFEGFESGSVGSWSSYPPAQDTAYDPTIWIKPLFYENASQRALYREIQPNYEIDYVFGVRKKLDMYVDHSSTLTFKCYIKSNRTIDGVKVRFGFADYSMVEKTIPYNNPLSWQECTINFTEIISQNVPKKLTAVAFMALCPHADPENLLRFGIDEVRINGMREAHWDFREPTIDKLEEWPDFIAGTHYNEGEELTISGNPPFPAGSVAVVISRALTGENEKIFRMKRSGTLWSLTVPLTKKSGITAGMWRATIKASSREKKDDTISTSLVFMVKAADAPSRNPRVLMSRDDAPKIMAKASSGRMQDIWERITKNARSYRDQYDTEDFNYNLDAYDEIYWLPTYGGYVTAFGIPANYIRSNGVVYGISGDTEAGEAARRALLKMAQWPSYVHPHILNQGQFTYWPVGQKLADFAIGYDMVCDLFTPSERTQVAQALYSKGITEVFKEYVRDNRVSSNTSNWIGDVTGGGILCCLAVMDDFQAEELEPYLTGMILKMNALIMNGFGEDGTYGEGYSYLNHALQCMNVAMPALERTFGIRFPEKFSRCHEFLFYHIDPETKDIYDFGDSTNRLGGFSNFSYLIAAYRDPYLKWLYDRSAGSSDVDLMFMDESVESKGPEYLPTVRLFEDVGTAVFRSGFSHEDFLFIFRCGPFYNHQHFDQGGFYLVDSGECFLGEVGRSDYYEDPWYQKLVIQPGGHNCILVNGNPESQRAGDLLHDVPAWKNFASITDFITLEKGAFVSGRLDPIYKDLLTYLRRSALYIHPRTIVLIDEVIGTPASQTIDLRFHAPKKEDITINGRDVNITRPPGILTIHTAAPVDYSAQVMKRPLTLYEFNGENAVKMKARGILQLSAELGSSREGTTFVNVLSTDSALMAGLNDRSYGDHVVLTVNGMEYYVNTACGNPSGKPYTEGSVTTDALVYADSPRGFAAMRTTTLSKDTKTIVHSDKPVSFEFQDGLVKTVTYSAPEKTTITFLIASKPRQVTLNGETIRNWRFNTKTGLTLELPADRGVIEIR